MLEIIVHVKHKLQILQQGLRLRHDPPVVSDHRPFQPVCSHQKQCKIPLDAKELKCTRERKRLPLGAGDVLLGRSRSAAQDSPVEEEERLQPTGTPCLDRISREGLWPRVTEVIIKHKALRNYYTYQPSICCSPGISQGNF